MSDGAALRIAVVLDGTARQAARQARALQGFLSDGIRLPAGRDAVAVTHLFFAEEADRTCLVGLAPTPGVRLIRTLPHRPDLLAAALTAFQTGGGADLFLFPDGALGADLAARLAARTGGGALTGVLDAEVKGEMLRCRRAVYSGHLHGAFTLRSRPWCIGLDASWADTRLDPPKEHVIQTVAGLPEDDYSVPGPLHDVEVLEQPPTGDLEAAAFLVVAGRGAGSRGGVQRIAAAAARVGAAFGVTRPVAMNAWAPPDRQIGVSGTRAAPAVCIVAGASGAPAFLWGVERSGFIAAVDTDDRAPITSEADAVVIDDAVAVLEALAALMGGGDG